MVIINAENKAEYTIRCGMKFQVCAHEGQCAYKMTFINGWNQNAFIMTLFLVDFQECSSNFHSH